MKARLVLPVLAALAALALAACGDSGPDSSDPASLAPADAPIYIQAVLRPTGELKRDVETLTSTVSGFSDPTGELIDWLNRSANEGEPTLSGKRLSFERDIEPWLGEQAGAFVEGLGDDPPAAGVIQTTDVDATQAFIDDGKQEGDTDRSYEGVDYLLGGDSDLAVGVLDEFLVLGSESAFKRAVDVSQGSDSLAGVSEFTDALDEAPEGSLADVYADVGALLEREGTGQSDQAVQAFRSIGFDPTDATAVASVIPGDGQVEIEVNSDLGGTEAPGGDVSELIGSLPAGAFAAFGASGFDEQLKEAIAELDRSGIPGEVPPNQLKSTLGAIGIDLDRIAGSLENAAAFAQGSGEGNLGGALVLTTRSGEAAETVANIGVLLRNTGVPGVTAVTGRASGFSIRDADLGRQPLLIVSSEDRIAIGYGRAPALRAVGAAGGATLSDTPLYEAAVSALGSTPLGAFVDGSGVLRLVRGLGAASDPDFRRARPYLAKVDFLAAGSGSDDDLTTTKLIIGVTR